ncbi:hypothetical protein HYX13_04385 [Candidatus Woesearchaeota archaeon]|nr:hypothetical protein [Candidatus Woesearchaeota archaeon]
MNQRWLLVMVIMLLPYSVLAYKINLDCNGDATDSVYGKTVTPGSEVSCDVNLVLTTSEEITDGGVKGFGVDFLLESDVYDFSSASMIFLHNDRITYSSDSDNFVESVNYESTSPNQFHLALTESSRASTPAEGFARLTFTAPAVEGELQFFVSPIMFGYFDGTNAVEQSCADVTQCTETGESSKVKVVVEKATSCTPIGDVFDDGILNGNDVFSLVLISLTPLTCVPTSCTPVGDIFNDGVLDGNDVFSLVLVLEAVDNPTCGSGADDLSTDAVDESASCLVIEGVYACDDGRISPNPIACAS